jgi:hypothetical protein
VNVESNANLEIDMYEAVVLLRVAHTKRGTEIMAKRNQLPLNPRAVKVI